jgi:hypothetical protein
MTAALAAGMVRRPMSKSETHDLLGPAAALADELLQELQKDRTRLPVLFPGLPRRTGKDAIGGGVRKIGDATVDLDAFRTCDLVAAHLVASIDATEAELVDLFSHGDLEERAMLLRSLNFLPLGGITNNLLGEALRTNVVLHLEAAMCDSDLLARTIEAGAVDADTANRLLLKFAFIDMDLTRAFGAESHASETLSTMLQDLATEREAAGRSVWRHTYRMLGLAPCAGAFARLLGGLEHGDDGVRQAAADGLLALRASDNDAATLIAQFARERSPREPRAAIKKQLEQLATN